MPHGQRRFPRNVAASEMADHVSGAATSRSPVRPNSDKKSASQKQLAAQTADSARGPDPSHHIYVSPAQMAAEYIAEMSEQLTLMARAQKLEMLAYLLDMARLEAEAIMAVRASVEPPVHSPGTMQGHFKI